MQSSHPPIISHQDEANPINELRRLLQTFINTHADLQRELNILRERSVSRGQGVSYSPTEEVPLVTFKRTHSRQASDHAGYKQLTEKHKQDLDRLAKAATASKTCLDEFAREMQLRKRIEELARKSIVDNKEAFQFDAQLQQSRVHQAQENVQQLFAEIQELLTVLPHLDQTEKQLSPLLAEIANHLQTMYKQAHEIGREYKENNEELSAQLATIPSAAELKSVPSMRIQFPRAEDDLLPNTLGDQWQEQYAAGEVFKDKSTHAPILKKFNTHRETLLLGQDKFQQLTKRLSQLDDVWKNLFVQSELIQYKLKKNKVKPNIVSSLNITHQELTNLLVQGDLQQTKTVAAAHFDTILLSIANQLEITKKLKEEILKILEKIPANSIDPIFEEAYPESDMQAVLDLHPHYEVKIKYLSNWSRLIPLYSNQHTTMLLFLARKIIQPSSYDKLCQKLKVDGNIGYDVFISKDVEVPTIFYSDNSLPKISGIAFGMRYIKNGTQILEKTGGQVAKKILHACFRFLRYTDTDLGTSRIKLNSVSQHASNLAQLLRDYDGFSRAEKLMGDCVLQRALVNSYKQPDIDSSLAKQQEQVVQTTSFMQRKWLSGDLAQRLKTTSRQIAASERQTGAPLNGRNYLFNNLAKSMTQTESSHQQVASLSELNQDGSDQFNCVAIHFNQLLMLAKKIRPILTHITDNNLIEADIKKHCESFIRDLDPELQQLEGFLSQQNTSLSKPFETAATWAQQLAIMRASLEQQLKIKLSLDAKEKLLESYQANRLSALKYLETLTAPDLWPEHWPEHEWHVLASQFFALYHTFELEEVNRNEHIKTADLWIQELTPIFALLKDAATVINAFSDARKQAKQAQVNHNRNSAGLRARFNEALASTEQQHNMLTELAQQLKVTKDAILDEIPKDTPRNPYRAVLIHRVVNAELSFKQKRRRRLDSLVYFKDHAIHATEETLWLKRKNEFGTLMSLFATAYNQIESIFSLDENVDYLQTKNMLQSFSKFYEYLSLYQQLEQDQVRKTKERIISEKEKFSAEISKLVNSMPSKNGIRLLQAAFEAHTDLEKSSNEFNANMLSEKSSAGTIFSAITTPSSPTTQQQTLNDVDCAPWMNVIDPALIKVELQRLSAVLAENEKALLARATFILREPHFTLPLIVKQVSKLQQNAQAFHKSNEDHLRELKKLTDKQNEYLSINEDFISTREVEFSGLLKRVNKLEENWFDIIRSARYIEHNSIKNIKFTTGKSLLTEVAGLFENLFNFNLEPVSDESLNALLVFKSNQKDMIKQLKSASENISNHLKIILHTANRNHFVNIYLSSYSSINPFANIWKTEEPALWEHYETTMRPISEIFKVFVNTLELLTGPLAKLPMLEAPIPADQCADLLTWDKECAQPFLEDCARFAEQQQAVAALQERLNQLQAKNKRKQAALTQVQRDRTAFFDSCTGFNDVKTYAKVTGIVFKRFMLAFVADENTTNFLARLEGRARHSDNINEHEKAVVIRTFIQQVKNCDTNLANLFLLIDSPLNNNLLVNNSGQVTLLSSSNVRTKTAGYIHGLREHLNLFISKHAGLFSLEDIIASFSLREEQISAEADKRPLLFDYHYAQCLRVLDASKLTGIDETSDELTKLNQLKSALEANREALVRSVSIFSSESTMTKNLSVLIRNIDHAIKTYAPVIDSAQSDSPRPS